MEADPASLARLFDRLEGPFNADRQLAFETITQTSRYVLDHRDSAFRIELFLLTDDRFDQARFARRQKHSYEGVPAWISSGEDVVVQKLRWLKLGRSPKHREDVRRVLAVSQPLWPYIGPRLSRSG